MAREQAPGRSLARSTEPLYREIRAALESARAGGYRAVNTAIVERTGRWDGSMSSMSRTASVGSTWPFLLSHVGPATV